MLEYQLLHPNDSNKSIARGTVGKGGMKNGKLVPCVGPNFAYFDATSYLAGRGFLHNKVLAIVLSAYETMYSSYPGRKFYIMECAYQNGGKLPPHRTHQNGLSVDFMMPKLKNNLPFYGLDTIGRAHYLLNFTTDGLYKKDTTIRIDFDLMAEHILTLQKASIQEACKIEKIIVHTGYLNQLFLGKHGKALKHTGIYFAQHLDDLLNNLHDEHYHVDFSVR